MTQAAMDKAQVLELTYQADSCVLLESLRALPMPVLLDSAHPHSERGRYDIVAAAPIDRLSLRHEELDNSYISNSNETYEKSFLEVKRALNEQLPALECNTELPFWGGAIGYFSYDLGQGLHHIPRPLPGAASPLMDVGLYGWAIITDHRLKFSRLVAHPTVSKQAIREVLDLLAEPPAIVDRPFRLEGDIHSNIDRQRYGQLFQRVQHYIHEGDCYQINLARRFHSQCQGDSWQAYRRLRALAAAPFSAFMSTEEQDILCFSPERFLQVQGNQVRTEPIKGTAPRSALPDRDAQLAETLLHSEKNRAENLMIVDLLRNDLGQCCVPGSIRVDKLFELQSFNTVHHLVSTVLGQLTPGVHPLELLGACFPGGSITGAPKKRAMEIIAELEPDRRSVYCGSMAYISADGQMDSNIAIRTMLRQDDQLLCWSGGGIVADSDEQEEFDETWNKVGKLLNGL